MSLWVDPPAGPGGDEAPPAPRRMRLARRVGWVVLGIGLALTALIAFVPAPYVIEQPGPVYNALGTVALDDEEVPLISIEGAESFPTQSTLDMLTVSRVGDPDHLPGWLTVLAAWFDPAKLVLPVEDVFPPGVTAEDRAEQGAVQMDTSQADSVAAALGVLDIPFESTIQVQSVAPDSPAEGVLEPGDVLVSVGGRSVTTMRSVQTAIREAGAGTPIPIEVLRDGEPLTVTISPVLALASDGNEYPVIGITGQGEYEFPLTVDFAVANVGGPSAGMVFSLAILDLLEQGDFIGDLKVAGTGTIDEDGNVGGIGGVRQKAFGASAAGAEIMLMPESNCGQLGGGLPSGLEIYPVRTLADAVTVIDTVRDGGDRAALPACPVG